MILPPTSEISHHHKVINITTLFDCVNIHTEGLSINSKTYWVSATQHRNFPRPDGIDKVCAGQDSWVSSPSPKRIWWWVLVAIKLSTSVLALKMTQFDHRMTRTNWACISNNFESNWTNPIGEDFDSRMVLLHFCIFPPPIFINFVAVFSMFSRMILGTPLESHSCSVTIWGD